MPQSSKSIQDKTRQVKSRQTGQDQDQDKRRK